MQQVEAIDALSRGIREVGEKYARKEMFVVELIFAASIMEEAINIQSHDGSGDNPEHGQHRITPANVRISQEDFAELALFG